MAVAGHNLVGGTLSSPAARACGLRGDIRKLSRAHVPPQAAGNTTKVLRAPDVIVNSVRQPGRWLEGGMWVRGLCEDCNNQAGKHYDSRTPTLPSRWGVCPRPSHSNWQSFRGRRRAPGSRPA
jgi:hypothetical protein